MEEQVEYVTRKLTRQIDRDSIIQQIKALCSRMEMTPNEIKAIREELLKLKPLLNEMATAFGWPERDAADEKVQKQLAKIWEMLNTRRDNALPNNES